MSDSKNNKSIDYLSQEFFDEFIDVCPDEEDIFLSEGGFNSQKFKKQLQENKPFVDEYSKKHPLIEVTATMESGYFEPAYVFDDGFGFAMTIKGIKKSLE
ncbi:MAG: hypothetical protein ABH986_06030 [archaeon]